MYATDEGQRMEPPAPHLPEPDAAADASQARLKPLSWLVLIVAFLLVVTSTAQLLYRATLPTDGWYARAGAFGTESGRQLVYYRNLVGAPSVLGARDRLNTVEGARVVPSALRLGSRAAETRALWDAGEPLTYSILRSGQFRQLEVPPVSWTLRAWLRFAVLDFERAAGAIGAVVLLLVAIMVFVRRHNLPAARVLLLLCSALFAQWISSSLPDGVSVMLDPAARATTKFFSYAIYLAFVAPTLAVFSLVFPARKPFIAARPWLLALPYIVAGILLVIAWTGEIAELYWLGVLPFLAVALTAILHALITVRDPVDSAQLRVAGWGLCLGIAVSGLTFLPMFGIVTGDAAAFMRAGASIGFTIVGITLALAVLRYRLFDIDLILQRSIVYTIVTALLIVIYFASIIILQSFFQSFVGQQSQFAVAISTLAIAALFNPLRRRVQDWIDERFYRSRYSVERIVAEFGRMAQDEPDLTRLTTELVNVIRDTVEPSFATLWLADYDRPAHSPRSHSQADDADSEPKALIVQ